MTKDFSVLMSVYINDKPHELGLSLESIFQQTLLPTEVILVEDGKLTDGLYSVIEDFREYHPQIEVVALEKNGGLANALNVGLAKCKYDYIARMDADDISLSERFEQQVLYLDEHPECDVVGTWAIEIKSDGSQFYHKQMPVEHEDCRRFFMLRDCMIHPTVMFRKEVLSLVGGYRVASFTKRSQDYDMFMLWIHTLVKTP